MGSLFSVALLFFTIFGILGLELFGGRFGYCMDPNYTDLPYGSRVVPGMNGNQTDYEECLSLPRYNLTRRTTDGILLTDMADIFPNEPWLDFVEFPQWMYARPSLLPPLVCPPNGCTPDPPSYLPWSALPISPPLVPRGGCTPSPPSHRPLYFCPRPRLTISPPWACHVSPQVPPIRHLRPLWLLPHPTL